MTHPSCKVRYPAGAVHLTHISGGILEIVAQKKIRLGIDNDQPFRKAVAYARGEGGGVKTPPIDDLKINKNLNF